MTKRPVAVLLVSLLFIVAGSIGLIYHSRELIWAVRSSAGSQPDWRELIEIAVITLVRALAILTGVFMLRARNWARWLCVAWLAFHVIVSIWHSKFSLLFHLMLLIVIA